LRRREIFAGVGSVAAAWPLAALAQKSAMPVIGYLHIESEDAFATSSLAAFRRGLHEVGYSEGQNVAIEYRFAENNLERLDRLSADLVRREVAVIVVLGGGSLTAMAAKAATSTIPVIVAFGGDPVKLGLVESMNRPGRNITGITFFVTELISKRLELLCEVAPQARKIAFLRLGAQTSHNVTEQMTSDALTAARALGRQLLILKIDSAQDLDAAFSVLLKERAEGLMHASAPFFDTTEINGRLAELTLRDRVPAIHVQRAFPAAGGLMSYGANQGEAYRQAGVYTGQILNGAKPADLPFQQSTKVELVINLKTAKALGLSVPQTILARADEVIE